jgi:hypothetical protein
MQADYERALEMARCRLDPVAWEVASAEGQVMTLDEAIDDVLASRRESVD